MAFIGVISEHQKFDIIKKNIQKNVNKNEITLININNKNIENLKNIKFDTIVLLDSIEKFKNQNSNLQLICNDIRYLIINSDIKIMLDVLADIKANILTFGLNHKSTITFSSITDENILISVQRSFMNKNEKLVEVGEYNLKINKEERTNLYEILVSFIIKQLYL